MSCGELTVGFLAPNIFHFSEIYFSVFRLRSEEGAGVFLDTGWWGR